MKTLDQIIATLRCLVKDNDSYLADPTDFQEEVARAVTALGQKNPRRSVYDCAGDGSTFLWDSPEGFIPGFSVIIRTEYPFDATGQAKAPLVASNEVDILRVDETVWAFRTKSFVAANGSTVRFTYTRHHEIGAESTLETVEDEDAVIYFAASRLLYRMAAACLPQTNPEENVDGVNQSPRYQSYMALAAHYEDLSGLKPFITSVAGASVFGRFPAGLMTNQPYFTHPGSRYDPRY